MYVCVCVWVVTNVVLAIDDRAVVHVHEGEKEEPHCDLFGREADFLGVERTSNEQREMKNEICEVVVT